MRRALPVARAGLLGCLLRRSCVRRAGRSCPLRRRLPFAYGLAASHVGWAGTVENGGEGSGAHTRWFVLRLSICFRKASVQRSLQRNLMTSSVSLKRGLSRENLPAAVLVSGFLNPLPLSVFPTARRAAGSMEVDGEGRERNIPLHQPLPDAIPDPLQPP